MSRIRLVAVSGLSVIAGVGIGASLKRRSDDVGNLNFAHIDNRDGCTPSLKGFPLPIVSAARTDNVPMVQSTGPTINLPQNRSEQIMKYGFPGFDNIRSYGDFVISYDNRNRSARWVFEHLTNDRVKSKQGIDREQCQFREDSSIHPFFRATNNDYRASSYDRGHLAAAANHRGCQRDMDETFLLSNITPQVGNGFNRGAWNQLEKFVRLLTKQCPNVYVCTGPLFLPRPENGKMYVKYEVVGRNNVAVPTHFFKVIVADHPTGGLQLLSFVLPNDNLGENVDLKKYLVPIDSIERASGLLFFDKIPRKSFTKINGF